MTETLGPVTTRPTLIAVDIDGTLLSSAGTVLPGTRAEFARARQAGATIALASGRPVSGLRRLVDRVALDSRGMAFVGVNGAMIVDADTGQTVAEHHLEPQLVRRIAVLGAEAGVVLMLCAGDELIVDEPERQQVQFEAEGNATRLRAVPSLRDLPDSELVVNKVLMTADPAVLRPFGERFAAEFDGQVEHSFSAQFYFEATPAGVDKGSAIEEIARSRGLSLADSVAFGDNYNDLPMVRAAGLGVAMGNATAGVRAAADRVTATNDDEGIAAVLADLFGDGEPAPPVPEPEQQHMYPVDLRTLGGLSHPDDL